MSARSAARGPDLRLLVPALAAWVAVAGPGLVAPAAAVGAGAVAALVAACVATLGRRHVASRVLALVLAATSVALASTAAQRAVREAGPVPVLAQQRAEVTLGGVITHEPRRADGGRVADDVVTVLRVAVESARWEDGSATVSSPVLVVVRGDAPQARWRDTVEVTGRLAPALPGDDVVAVLRSGEVTVRGGPGPLLTAADSLRDRYRRATAGLPPDARGLVPALVIGDTSQTPPDLTEAMLATGMSHLSAVSGSNVTLVLAAALGVGRLARLPRRFRPLLALAVLGCFVVLARPEPSVVRAAVMGSVGLAGLWTARRGVGPPALSAAVLGLLLMDPWLARSPGFALSVVATLALILFAGPWGRAMGARLPTRLRWLGPALAVPLAAQAACAPLVVPLQGSVSLVALPANLLAAPCVAPATIVGVVVALLAAASVPVASVVAWLAAPPALAIGWVARTAAEVPGGAVPWDDSVGSAFLLAGVVVLLVMLAPWLSRRVVAAPLLAAALVLTAAALTVPTRAATWPPPSWVLVACDVGQGDALVVRAGEGSAVVVDTGPEPRAVDGCLDRLGVDEVPLVVLTHFHADHVGGLEGVLRGRSVGQIRATPVTEPAEQVGAVAELARTAGVPLGTLAAGDAVAVGQVRARVWWPARRIDAGSVANNASVVLTVRAHDVSALLLGDVEHQAAAEIVRRARNDPLALSDVDVVKVAHHGSANRDDRLLDLVAGRVAVVSVGADNDYGHPAPSTLEALRSRGYVVHRTDTGGDLAVVAGGGSTAPVVVERGP